MVCSLRRVEPYRKSATYSVPGVSFNPAKCRTLTGRTLEMVQTDVLANAVSFP